MSHDIIDNRSERLLDHINRILPSTAKARFAVGYFFVSGLEPIAEKLADVKEVRLLIGNTTNRQTLEQLAEGYRRLDLVADAVEAQRYPKRAEMKRMTTDTAGNVRSALELMDQTDQAQTVVQTVVRLIEEERLLVRTYIKGRMHAKAYIFDYGPVFDKAGKAVPREEHGIAVVGSSNLTLAGIAHNTELNVIVHGNDNHAGLVAWFEELWEESAEFAEHLMHEMRESWAVASVRPYDIYMKTLYALVKDRLEGEEEHDILWDDEITRSLADFQKVAVRQAVQIIRDYGGCFVADVVGLGKSFIGAAVVKHFERTEHARPLVICPASLVEMWERYNEVYHLNARVLSMGYLREHDDGTPSFLVEDVKYRDRDFVLIDESHNLRHSDTQRYRVVEAFLATGRRCCFLTATPRNKSAWDIYHQIKLFCQDDQSPLPVDPPNLKPPQQNSWVTFRGSASPVRRSAAGNRANPSFVGFLLAALILSAGLARAGRRSPVRGKKPQEGVWGNLRRRFPQVSTHKFCGRTNLKDHFKLIEDGQRKLPGVLQHVLIRRLRSHILRFYGYDAQSHERVDPSRFHEYLDGRRRAYVMVGGRHQFFPKRELDTIEYSIEETYQGLYQRLRKYLGTARKGQPPHPIEGELTYARYGLWHYVMPHKQQKEPYASLHRAGANLRGLIRMLLFKRLESSVHAFRETVRRVLKIHRRFLTALEGDIVPAGEEAQAILCEADTEDAADLQEALRGLATKYDAADFDTERLRQDIEHDVGLLETILGLVEPITPDQDAKLTTLKARLAEEPLKTGKRLIFTQYAETAAYLFDNLNPGGSREDTEVIYGGDKSKGRVVGRFAPKANPEYTFRGGECELNTLIATDVLAEGLNLQDCDKIINYDLHWNPVRLIQRFGRIDRIGSEHTVIFGFNCLPETGIERNLGLKQKLQSRIKEIHETIGEDSAILEKSEELNEAAMYAIYEKKGEQLSCFEDEDDEVLDLNEAEELLRQLRKGDPVEYERIANLRDGIRTAMPSNGKGLYVFCQAGRYQQVFLLDAAGEVVSRDIPRVVGAIKCGPELAGAEIPRGYNAAVMRAMRLFAEEVKHRAAARDHGLSLTQGQRYALRELRVLFGAEADEDTKGQINVLDRAFRGTITTAVNRELNRIRRNAITGRSLLRTLTDLYVQHNMRDWLDRHGIEIRDESIPRVVCSEALV